MLHLGTCSINLQLKGGKENTGEVVNLTDVGRWRYEDVIILKVWQCWKDIISEVPWIPVLKLCCLAISVTCTQLNTCQWCLDLEAMLLHTGSALCDGIGCTSAQGEGHLFKC